MKNFKNYVSTIILLSLFVIVYGQRFEGDRCYESQTRSNGICKRYNECGSAYNAYRNNNIRFDICSYYFDLAIVCCVENPQSTGNRWPSSNNNNNRPSRPRTVTTTRRPATTTSTTTSRPRASSSSSKRLAEEKCTEYTEGVTTSFGIIPLTLDPIVQNFTQPKCDYVTNPLIVGGDETEVGEFPHMAALGWSNPVKNNHLWLCGGSLISERFILTAAHCTYHSQYGRPKVARLGDHDLREGVNDGADPITLDIEEIIKHPLYESPQKYHDIALFKLNYDIQFDSYVRPACLYTNRNLRVKTVIATGWGTIAYKARQTSDVLRKVALTVFPNEDCKPHFVVSRNWRSGFSEDQMCAGDDNGGKDTCQGDSGGPLQIEDDSNPCVFYVVGVTGFGGECGNAKGSGVYAIVSHYLDWIVDEVWVKNQ